MVVHCGSMQVKDGEARSVSAGLGAQSGESSGRRSTCRKVSSAMVFWIPKTTCPPGSRLTVMDNVLPGAPIALSMLSNALPLGVPMAVGVGETNGTGVRVAVIVRVSVAVSVAVSVDVAVAVVVGIVAVAVWVSVAVGELPIVIVTVGTGVSEGVGLSVGVGVSLGVDVGGSTATTFTAPFWPSEGSNAFAESRT
jgi:hypothetical protein